LDSMLHTCPSSIGQGILPQGGGRRGVVGKDTAEILELLRVLPMLNARCADCSCYLSLGEDLRATLDAMLGDCGSGLKVVNGGHFGVDFG